MNPNLENAEKRPTRKLSPQTINKLQTQKCSKTGFFYTILRCPMLTPDHFNKLGAQNLPGYLGIVVTHVGPAEVRSELQVKASLMAPNGFLHAGSFVALADTSAGYGCVANLPEGAIGFTTIELKSNHVGTAREGMIECIAKAVHLGKTTQLWDAIVIHRETGKTIALFRCTQMVLYDKPGT
ncbi:uncharacterized protein (TIGR00369 family) [Methylocaldum sp. RMAD-M]|nr:uncharacterized protein (TIGR00369 family) [Methylocaldum sp. RMAD-M]